MLTETHGNIKAGTETMFGTVRDAWYASGTTHGKPTNRAVVRALTEDHDGTLRWIDYAASVRP